MSELVENKETTQAEIPQGDLREKVLAALKTIYDPEIPVDIYELGLIYEISVYPVNNVFFCFYLNFSTRQMLKNLSEMLTNWTEIEKQ